MAVVFRVLGPLEVWFDGAPVKIGGARQRALLAMLLLNANRVVSREQLIDELLSWSWRSTRYRPDRLSTGPGQWQAFESSWGLLLRWG